jgi:hypothetical protein
MLTPVIPPTTKNLMAPETVLARLGLPESALPEITLQVEEASGLVARYLGYECAYGTWDESFLGVSGGILDLGARPAWSVISVTQNFSSGAGFLPVSSYSLRRGPYGESSIYRPNGWGSLAGRYWYPDDLTVAGTYMVPDYTARYTAGWWLDEMPIEDIPAGVQPFPPELRADFLRVMRWYRGSLAHNSAVRRMREEGAEVEYFSAADQAVDARTGIPESCCLAMSLYRRAV